MHLPPNTPAVLQLGMHISFSAVQGLDNGSTETKIMQVMHGPDVAAYNKNGKSDSITAAQVQATAFQALYT